MFFKLETMKTIHMFYNELEIFGNNVTANISQENEVEEVIFIKIENML